MKILAQIKYGRMIYIVQHNFYTRKKNKSFLDAEECLNYAMKIPEWVERIDPSIMTYIKENNHIIRGKGGFREFCV